MKMNPFNLVAISMLTACSSGQWIVTTWGEEYIEQGIPSDEFVDGCSAKYDTFEVEFASAMLLDASEEVVGEMPSGRFELTSPGPQELGSVPVRAGDYERVYYEINTGSEDAVHAAGTVTCGGETVSFDWTFPYDTRYRCLPLDITVDGDADVVTELTIHGDHLFYDSLDDNGPELRGQAIVDADADGDGVVTSAELEAVTIAGLGYPVDIYVDITDLSAFISHLVQGIGHVDGEGHCYVDR